MTAVEFGLLGAIEARIDGQQIELGHARQRHVLAALLVDADRLVPIADLAARIWGEQTPHSGLTPLYGYLSRLRHVLAPAERSVRIVRQPGGYMAAVNPADVDLHRFRQLMARARSTDEPTRAMGLFHEALALWRGEPFASFDNPWFNSQRVALLRERESAEFDLRDLRLRCGQHAEVLTEVSGAFEADPMNERVAGQLMLALYRQGQSAEALTCYDRMRSRLADELGVPPSPQLQRLYQRILEADPELVPTALPASDERAPAVQARAWSAPALLPPSVPDFTGRMAEIASLCKHLTDDWGSASSVTTIVGMGGIGKTALSVHVAQNTAASYTDGQLWANLRGASDTPAKSTDVLARFLRALGVPDRAIPADPDERMETYRTLVNGRKILIVLDDAASEEQVRPLLPGTPTCAVVITSRARLVGLEGAHRIDLDVFATDEAIDLFTQIVDEDRVTPELSAATEIVELCGGLPLAVRIAGARLAARPAWRLAHLAEMLSDERRRLDQLSAGDLAVRASLALSYRGLDELPRRLFRLLGLFSAPDFPPWLASMVLECPVHEATEYAEALVDAQLLATSGTDAAGQYRYRFHDLVRLFAAERAAEEETAESRTRALEQGMGGWLGLAERMSALVPGPCFAPIASPAPRPPTDHLLEDFRPEWAANWFDAERGALLSTVRQACRLGMTDFAFDLAQRMEKYFDVRGMYTDWIALNTQVMALCQESGNALGEAVMLRGLIDVTTWADVSHEDAMARQYDESLRLREMFTELGLPQGVADAALMGSWSLTANAAYTDAITLADEALRLATESGHLGGQARAELSLALAHFENRDVLVAIGHADNALVKARELGNTRCIATALQFAGIGYRVIGDFDVSKQMLDESLELSRSSRDYYTEVLTLLALARLYFNTGDPEARPTAEAAISLSRDYNMSHHLGEALEILGSIEIADGRPAKAIPYLEESVALWRTRGWHSFHATALTSLGKAYTDVDPQAARAAFRAAHDLFVQVGNIDQATEVARLAES